MRRARWARWYRHGWRRISWRQAWFLAGDPLCRVQDPPKAKR